MQFKAQNPGLNQPSVNPRSSSGMLWNGLTAGLHQIQEQIGASQITAGDVLCPASVQAINESCLEALLQQAQRRQHLSARHSSSISNTATAANNSALYSTVEVLVQKMYKYKLEALLKEHQTTLMRCVVCQQLFSVSSHKKLQCPTLAAAATER